MDCEEVATTYKQFKEPLCDYVQNGFIEILMLGCIGIPLEIGLLFLGIRFVLRNKVDVPKYEPPKKKNSKPKKKKSKSKKSRQGSEGGIDDGVGFDQNNILDEMDVENSNYEERDDEVDSDLYEDQDGGGCCGCKRRKPKGKQTEKKINKQDTTSKFGTSQHSMLGQSFAGNEKLLEGLNSSPLDRVPNYFKLQQNEIGDKQVSDDPGAHQNIPNPRQPVSINNNGEML